MLHKSALFTVWEYVVHQALQVIVVSASIALGVGTIRIASAQPAPLVPVADAVAQHESADGKEVPSSDEIPLPDALHVPEQETFPPVEGPTRLRADPRAQLPPQPKDLEEFLRRFYPTYPWVLKPQTHRLDQENPRIRTPWRPRAGACYVVLALDERLRDADARQKSSHRTLLWWEFGADVDVRVEDQESGALLAVDMSRLLLAHATWCSDGSPVFLDVQLGVPADTDETVHVSWGVAALPNSLLPLRFRGEDPLSQRLQWAQSMVVPRGEARSAPHVISVRGPMLVSLDVPRPSTGCEVLLAAAEPTVQDLSLAFETPSRDAGDFETKDVAALPICAPRQGEPSEHRILLGVRMGTGRIVLQRFHNPD